MATPAKRQCLETNGEAGPSSKSTIVVHSTECRGTIEEADLLAEKFLEAPDIDKSGSESCQLLSSAIKTGHFNCIESLLDAGIDVNGEYSMHKNAQQAHFSFTKTALISAIHKGRFNIVKLLVSRGARVNPLPLEEDDNLFRYPLFHALNRDNPEMVALLLDLGADPNRYPMGRQGISFIELALQTGRKKIFKMLVEHGARITKPYSYINSAIQRRDMDTFKCLIKHDAFLNCQRVFPDDEGLNPHSVLLKVIESHEKGPKYFTKQNVKTFLHLLKTFGFNFWTNEVEDLLEDLQEKSVFDIVEDIETLRATPQTLKAISRVAIHRIVGVELPRRIKHMNLPTVLQTYLMYKDAEKEAVLQDNLPNNTIMISGGQRQVLIFHFPARQ